MQKTVSDLFLLKKPLKTSDNSFSGAPLRFNLLSLKINPGKLIKHF